ncbi:uncharacterized protein LOC123006899 [Tribolium madens]|uniref:uncharacterized protein LOC123006899 n=1 Tax=Tribolium madens TaxID=41895 RepID=UPI001CF73DB6|nr:uncharacterized protein LOC123006899 [Tribolium madens]XP_044257743.1 uncharacterized protein LOC123006899 [Tribolium madens]
MVIISKPLFYEKLEPTIKCRDLVHPDISSCTKANLKLCLEAFLPGVFYFYLPIHLLQVILDYKKINRKNFLKNLLKNILRSESFGVTFGGLAIATICLHSHLSERLRYYTLLLLPGIVAGISIRWEHPRNRQLNTILWASLVVEALFKNAYYFKIFTYSPIKETLIFMLVSSSLMHLFINRDKKQIPFNLWFYKPSDPKKYKFTLYNYFREISKYFGFGYGLNSIRCVLKDAKMMFKSPLQFIRKTAFNRSNLKFGIIIGLYVGLFRGVSVLLQKYSNLEKANAAIAGLVAGISYYIEPNMTILTTAVVTVLQILCKQISTIPEFRKIPFTELVFMFCNGILFFNRIVAPVTCPKYYTNMLQITANGELEKIYIRLVNKYLP